MVFRVSRELKEIRERPACPVLTVCRDSQDPVRLVRRDFPVNQDRMANQD